MQRTVRGARLGLGGLVLDGEAVDVEEGAYLVDDGGDVVEVARDDGDVDEEGDERGVEGGEVGVEVGEGHHGGGPPGGHDGLLGHVRHDHLRRLPRIHYAKGAHHAARGGGRTVLQPQQRRDHQQTLFEDLHRLRHAAQLLVPLLLDGAGVVPVEHSGQLTNGLNDGAPRHHNEHNRTELPKLPHIHPHRREQVRLPHRGAARG
mmetsp:Transcript_19292/g.34399  ORF Transcript_19292/g.34399 Transcript_19292/m.34399 type:complete len:204 (+) Transcript_19292:75-686(+)